MDDISEKLNSLFAGGFLRLTLSCPSGNTYKKVVFKPSGKGFFVELFAGTKVYHENLAGAAAFTRALGLLSEHFKNADCETADMLVYMRRLKSGRLLISEKKSRPSRRPLYPLTIEEKIIFSARTNLFPF